eukprot:Phypoly_transcript_05601.p1 GENE.Phypoly_transcript_05601~~Phypoly_transcript_05601.p1  ORF type:complete len:600 (+),score=77.53 Phypoly_transcript_05601:83-1801(+)
MAVRAGSLKKVAVVAEPPKVGGTLAKLSSTPKSEIPLRSGSVLKKSSSSRFQETSAWSLEKLPSFKDIPVNLRTELLQRKLQQCCVLFDFTDTKTDLKQKEIKREALLQCVEYLLAARDPLTESVYHSVFTMVATNLFRPLPPHVNPSGVQYDPEEDEPILEAGWSHIQIVYELFLRFIDAPDFNTQIAKTFIDQKFILQLLELFDSEDPRERDYLKTTLHRIYGKFLPLRGFIRTAIRDLFCTFIYESRRHNGIAEILEVLGSIINGFAVPLKEEHKLFLSRVLMPLHKPKNLTLYNTQLTYCICQFLDKEPGLIETVFKLLLRMWPMGNSPKEVLFLNEVEELLNVVDELHFKRVRVPIFKRVCSCFKSEHFQVAERALYLWSNDHVVSLVADSVEIILPIIYGVLFFNAYHHWNRTIRSLSLGSLQLFQEIDGALYNKIARQHKEEQEKANPKPAPAPSGKPQGRTPFFTPQNTKQTISPAEQGKPQEGPPIRRKSLLPVDPSTLAALTVHKSLEDIVASGDDYDNDTNSNNSDYEDDADMDDDRMSDEEQSPPAPPPASLMRQKIRSS